MIVLGKNYQSIWCALCLFDLFSFLFSWYLCWLCTCHTKWLALAQITSRGTQIEFKILVSSVSALIDRAAGTRGGAVGGGIEIKMWVSMARASLLEFYGNITSRAGTNVDFHGVPSLFHRCVPRPFLHHDNKDYDLVKTAGSRIMVKASPQCCLSLFSSAGWFPYGL